MLELIAKLEPFLTYRATLGSLRLSKDGCQQLIFEVNNEEFLRIVQPEDRAGVLEEYVQEVLGENWFYGGPLRNDIWFGEGNHILLVVIDSFVLLACEDEYRGL